MTKSTLLIVALMLCAAANFVRLSAQEADQKIDANNPLEAQPSAEISPDKIDPSADGASDAAPAGSYVPVDSFGIDFVFDDSGVPVEITLPAAELKPAVDPSTLPAPIAAESADVLTGYTFAVDEFSQVKPLSLDFPAAGPPVAMPMPAETMKVETEAVIDMSEVFRRSIHFASETERLKAAHAQLQSQMEEMGARLQAQQRLLNDTEGDRHAELERQMVELQVEMVLSAKSQQSMQQAEAEIYLNTYRRVRTVIAEYARENGIQTVRRVSAAVTEEDMNAQQILEWINRDIVYSADEPRDITQDIIERLNAVDGRTGSTMYPQPGTLAYPVVAPLQGYPVPTIVPGATFDDALPAYGSPSPYYVVPGGVLTTVPEAVPGVSLPQPVHIITPAAPEGGGSTLPPAPATTAPPRSN